MYLKWDEKIITDFSEINIDSLYNRGYLFGRIDKGNIYQTRSLRIDLAKFTLSSENRRVLKKTENLKLTKLSIPYANYHWKIGKLGKDFYATKFGEKTFSANKIKELLTNSDKSNFNKLFIYSLKDSDVGYCIVRETDKIIHYCYPFYQLHSATANLGLGMMLHAILFAQTENKKYIYLGSFQRPTDTYKLQFSGLEWFNGERWQTDLSELKKLLK